MAVYIYTPDGTEIVHPTANCWSETGSGYSKILDTTQPEKNQWIASAPISHIISFRRLNVRKATEVGSDEAALDRVIERAEHMTGMAWKLRDLKKLMCRYRVGARMFDKK